jgi:hypothetical protein
VSRESGEVPIVVSLPPASRFLTLATTDGGDSIWGDWTMFADPKLAVEAAEQ